MCPHHKLILEDYNCKELTSRWKCKRSGSDFYFLFQSIFVRINRHFSPLHVVKALTLTAKLVVGGVLAAGTVGCSGG